MRNRRDVADFFLPIDPSIADVADVLYDAVTGDDPAVKDAVLKAFQAVQSRLSDDKRPIITKEQALLYDRVKRQPRLESLPGVGDADFVNSLTSVLNLRVDTALRSINTRAWRQDLLGGLGKVPVALNNLADDFFGELIIETEVRSNKYPSFAQQLENSAKRIGAIRPHLESVAGPFKALLQNNGGGDCECVIRACNNYECRNFCIESWWTCLLIFIGLILVLVLA